MKIKTYQTIFTKEMYDRYKNAQDKEKYINELIACEKDKGINGREDFFNLLFSKAVKYNDLGLIKEILNSNDKNTYPSLLANVDIRQMSPMSYTLLLDDEGKIKEILKDYLNQNYYFQKIALNKEAFLKIQDTIGYQGESYQECINELIKPIIIEEQVKALGGFYSSIDEIFPF